MTSQQRGLLQTLARMNRTAAFLIVLAVAALGLFLPGSIGALVLFALVAALAALLRQTWAVTPPPLRVVRIIILAAIAAVAVAKVL